MSKEISFVIETKVVDEQLSQTVNARELHAFLGTKKDFSDWMKAQINSLELEEKTDYIALPLKGDGGKFTPIEYIITLDTAKHIAMASRTANGKEVRKYFIEVEKKWKKQEQEKMYLALEPLQEENAMLKTKLERYEYEKISPKQITVLKDDIKAKVAAITRLRDENFIVPDFRKEEQALRDYFDGAMFSNFPLSRYNDAKRFIAERLNINTFVKMWKLEK